MKNLTALLERLTKVLNKDEILKSSVIDAIKNKAHISLASDKILIREGILEIEASPAVKSEIRLKEELIRSELKEVYNVNIVRVLYK